jgi:lysozyme family protein
MEIDQIISGILKTEGWPEYTNNPNDRGGPTKGGITLATLQDYRKDYSLTADDVLSLEEDEAREIYRRAYVSRPGFGKIKDSFLMENVIDAGVLHGTGWAARRLQEVVKVKVDSVVGPITLNAVNMYYNHKALNLRFTARRAKRVAKIVSRNPSQLVWLDGWMNRTVKFILKEALRQL